MVDDAEVQRQIREQLAELPQERMPSAVASAIMMALDAEQTARGAARPARRRWPLLVAAGFALLAGAAIVPRLPGTAPDPGLAAAGCPVTVEPGTDLTPVVHQTGRVYTTAGLPDATLSLLPPQGSACGGEQATAAQPPETSTAQASNRTGADLTRCLQPVVGGQTLIAVDRGFYRGQEVLVAVTYTSPRVALVVDCTPAPATVMYRTDLP